VFFVNSDDWQIQNKELCPWVTFVICVLGTSVTFVLFWVNSKIKILLLVYCSRNYQKTKSEIYADKNHNKILQTLWAMLRAHLVKKTSFSLYPVCYKMKKTSAYKKSHLQNINTFRKLVLFVYTYFVNGTDYMVQFNGLLVTSKMLQITNDTRYCL
jgi:hypothetical protein